MSTAYIYQDRVISLNDLRYLFPNTSIPDNPNANDLALFGVTVLPDAVIKKTEQQVTELAGTLKSAKADKRDELNAVCDAVIRGLTTEYSDGEAATFFQQETEARAYSVSSTLHQRDSITPMLTAMATTRNIPLCDLVQRVLTNANALSRDKGAVIGQCQALKDKVDRCTRIEQVLDLDAHVIKAPHRQE